MGIPPEQRRESACLRLKEGTIRARAYLLIIGMQALLTCWVADSEIARGIYMVSYSLMTPTVLYLLAARGLGRFLPFARQEILLCYIVLTCTLPLIGFGGMRYLLTGMGYVAYFARTDPQWARFLGPLSHLPILQEPEAIQGFYQGRSAVPWSAWTVPIAFWSVYLLLLSGVWLGLAAVLHRLWIRQERLTFPITVLPLQLTDTSTDTRDSLFRQPLFWLGASLPVVFQSLLAIHEWYPTIPAFPLKAADIRPALFPSPPWSSIPEIQIGYYPMAAGLAYFVPGNISFSCWFFLLLSKFSFTGSTMLGLGSGGPGFAGRFPFREEQAAGSWIGFALIALWGVRSHFSGLWADLSAGDRHAMRLWATAGIFCFVLCVGAMALTGVPPALAAVMALVYVAYVLAGARVRAEAGGMWTFAPAFWTPFRVANSSLGNLGVSESALVAGGHFSLAHMDIRAQSLPFLLEGLKIADTVGIRGRTVLTAVAVGTVSALALGWWFSLTQFYSLGAATAKSATYPLIKAQVALREMSTAVINRQPWDRPGMGALGFAAALTISLAALRARFLGFPLHPIGYVLANTYTMNAMLVPVFFAWLVKTLVLRYGGSRLYRRSIPFFVGLTLGDIGIQAIWTLIGRILDLPVYQFLS